MTPTELREKLMPQYEKWCLRHNLKINAYKLEDFVANQIFWILGTSDNIDEEAARIRLLEVESKLQN
jgi:hypothetical protein